MRVLRLLTVTSLIAPIALLGQIGTPASYLELPPLSRGPALLQTEAKLRRLGYFPRESEAGDHRVLLRLGPFDPQSATSAMKKLAAAGVQATIAKPGDDDQQRQSIPELAGRGPTSEPHGGLTDSNPDLRLRRLRILEQGLRMRPLHLAGTWNRRRLHALG